MSIAKKTKTPRKTQQNQQPTENQKTPKYQSVNERGPSFCIFLAKGRSRPSPPVSYATAHPL